MTMHCMFVSVGTSGGLIAAISARLAPQLSPRNSRRSIGGESQHSRGSQDSLSLYTQSPHKGGPHTKGKTFKAQQIYRCIRGFLKICEIISWLYFDCPPGMTSNPAVQPAFLDKLSATLRQRQVDASPNKACTVRQIINTKAQAGLYTYSSHYTFHRL